MKIRPWHVLVLILGITLMSPATEFVAHLLLGSHAPGPNDPIYTFCEKVGEALVIAVFLALFVDEAVKHTLVKEVSRDVLDFAVGFTLPPAVKKRVMYILRFPFVREDFTIHYTLERLPADPAAGPPASGSAPPPPSGRLT